MDDLVEYLSKNPFPVKEIYLLRNSTKSKGVGFYVVNTYYPDFIMWIKEKDQQRVLFIDPKGLTHISFKRQADESKLDLYKHLKNEIQPDLKRKDVKLDAFTVSVTDWRAVQTLSQESKSIKEFAKDRHILFQYNDTVNNIKTENKDYIKKMFEITFSNN